MAQLHYYGSVFELATDRTDEEWREDVSRYRTKAAEIGRPITMVLRLAVPAEHEVTIMLSADDQYAVVHRAEPSALPD